MKNILIAATCALLFSSCSSPAGESSESNSWREIASGSQSNIEQATREVIQSPEAWQKWWRKHRTVETLIDGKIVPEPVPEVDFEKKTVLIATMGMLSTGGYSIRFTEIHRENDLLTATVETTSPGPDSIVTKAFTAPFSVIAIPKHEGRVEFTEETAP